jgi:sodium transport system permease protein
MSWRNVKLIYAREIRDQLRDRRTLFMIAVLPLLLYPLLGMSVFQLSQFLRKNESKVLVMGTDQVTAEKNLPPLVKDGQFAEALFDDPTERGRLKLEISPGEPTEADLEAARGRLKSGDIQLVVRFPDDFGKRLEQLREEAEDPKKPDDRDASRESAAGVGTAAGIPDPEVLSNTAREKSRLAQRSVERVLNNWRSQLVRQNLLAGRVPENFARPFQLKSVDVAEPRQQEAALWAKIVPFVLFIWALTGAFYPAVDLCAGEKERGTLETLLSSPALRSEIVWGKLLTVMTFSIATATLNLTSLGVTAQYVVNQMQSLMPGEAMTPLGFPPLTVILCLLVALVPMSALFSALCLACAAFARSTKEGQYYLMPLLLVTMPLMMLPMSPGSELDLGNSLIPITGVVLLLRTLVEGNYADALPYVLPVAGMTLVCCLLAIRWAVYQFNQESVLFRESERLDLRRWVVHLVRDRQETPSLAEAFFCVAIIFVVQFFTRLAISSHVPADPDFSFFALLLFISQVVCIALPALLMTLFFTRSWSKTLLLDRVPQLAACVAAVALTVTLHPLGQQLVIAIQKVYPLQEGIAAETQTMERMISSAPYWWLPFLLMAVLPAICEELAFRGFILSGLRHVGHKWWAIALSAVFFGIAHTVVQQSLAAAALGLVLGYIAVQTTSLIPAMLFHASYNSIMLGLALSPRRITELADRWPIVNAMVVESPEAGMTYRLPVLIVAALLSLGILAWFHRLPYLATREEALEDARALQSQQLVGSE